MPPVEQQGRSEAPWPTLVALLGVLAVVAGVFFIFSGNITSSTPDDVAAEQEEPNGEPTDDAGTGAPTEDPEPTEAPTSGETAPPELVSNVGVLDGTGAGMAETAEQLLSDGGWPVMAAQESSDRPEETTIYYPDDSLEESAQALADQFPVVTAVEPTGEGLTDQHMVLVLGADFAETVDEGETTDDEMADDEMTDDEMTDDETVDDDTGTEG